MSTGTIQTVNLADNINAAFDKINENFELVETGVFSSLDSSSVTNIIDGHLDSSYFITVINEDYFNSLNINMDVDLTDVEAGIAANASSLLTLTASINQTDSGITVLAAQQQATQAQLDGIVVGGIDSDLLADAVANANSTLISRIDATDSDISVFGGRIDSVSADLLLRDSATNDRIDIQTSAVSALTSTVTANTSGLSAVVSDVTTLDASLTQLISDGITITPEQVTEAIGGALDDLTLRMNADSDKLILEAEKITDLKALVETVDSEGNPTTFLALATESLQSQVTVLSGQVSTNASWGIDLVAGTESDPHIAGIKFGNDGTTADFTLIADTFKIVNATNNAIQPFTVSGNDVYLSNATVTGGLNIGSNLTGAHMEMTNDTTKIYDENGQLRVQLGNLAGL